MELATDKVAPCTKAKLGGTKGALAAKSR